MIWRHKEVVTRYNANLDSLNPLSLQNIIREVEKIERMRDLETKRSTSSQQMTLPCMQSNLVNNASLNLNRNIRENSTKKHSLVTNKRKRDGKIFQNLIRMHTLKFPRLNKNRSELREKIRKLKESLKVELQEDSTLEISKAENDSAPIELAKEDSSCSLGVSDYRPEVHSRGFVSLDSYRCGIHCYWRILWSEKVSRPFFFNSRTKIGQFNEPSHQNCPS